ncbi:MAG: aldehyde dehydrogenase [Deltaproteobacteria bacterium]|nr:aldehyde dehydrogenase [Deltaproteobacteria bacterium]
MAFEVPILRLGRDYASLDLREAGCPRTGGLLARVGLANPGLVRRDAREAASAAAALRSMPTAERIARCEAAAAIFAEAALPVTAGGPAVPFDEYLAQVSATTGLPLTLCREHAGKLERALSGMGRIVCGLTRGLAPEHLDRMVGEERGVPVAFHPTTDTLAVLLPSNAPGVNALWLPALALGVPVALKPGQADPWTPLRLARALMAAGLPAAAFSLYPGEHDAGQALLDAHARAMVFGDAATVSALAGRPGIQAHGPGWSKVLLGDDAVADWPELLDMLETSVVSGAGRSCINASTIVLPRDADALADALARRLAAITPRAFDDPGARLAGFVDPRLPEAIDDAIARALATPGAEDVTARHRPGPRLVTAHGQRFLLPTVVRCHDPEHPLARQEYLFPFVAVVEVPTARAPAWLGPTLSLTLVTADAELVLAIARRPEIDRLNLGRVPTSRVDHGQPHQGNLFELLWRRRALQREVVA